MKKLWEKYAAILAISAALIGTGITFAPVLAYDSRISASERSIAGLKETVANVNGKLDVLLGHFGLYYKPEESDDRNP